ncbi:membrane protein insertion efficiency factor YidD [Candidatus Rhodoluna planktonica]|uniref:Putative membrane protein insertion efficiency factor n=1 Tax=Candidatus Rhodoluna planktonica TaxID=535712 RepID=A0A1D9E0Q5_9MICO|nr:membrane protein insertion efficiency factor YidD [Candidatus Rhodoluna planktonica]AOY56648.1 membrane protein insertion efficiency factor YidD [Candidatus Rhodoluna planktonica]
MKALLFVLLAPRNVVIALVKLYRRVISPLYGDVCRYYPSCSAYGLGQFQQRGVLVGSFLTAFRILRCNPWSQGGVDEVKPGFNWFRVTDTGYVVPNLRKVD